MFAITVAVSIGCADTKSQQDRSESDEVGVSAPVDSGSTHSDAKAALAPDSYKDWDTPVVTLFITGRQNGYIEPCGCTGLEKQKGGIARRQTFIKQLQNDGWDLLPIDVGNQVRRIGQQAIIKLSTSDRALKTMKYQSVGFGPGDIRLPAAELLAIVAADDPESAQYVSANVVVFDPSFIPTHKVVERGKIKVGMTNVLDPISVDGETGSDTTVGEPIECATKALAAMEADGSTFKVLSFFGTEASGQELMRQVPGFDLIIVSGGYGEPAYKPVSIEGSSTRMIVTGEKGMYAGLVGLYEDQPMKYARVPLSHEFADDTEMRALMAEYQKELERLGFDRLGLQPVEHPSGQKFVGTKACAECHQDAYDIWEGSPHADATASIVSPPEDRGDVPRHFDPECLSCHVTGWNPKNYYPYESGYVDLDSSKHLHGNGCENCHGPGSAHVVAEKEGSDATEEEKLSLRATMQLPYENAKEHCMKCHDLDNSPDFHDPGAFEEEFWPQIEH